MKTEHKKIGVEVSTQYYSITTKELNNSMKGLIDIQIEDSDKDNFLLIKDYVKIKEKNKISIKVLVCEDKTSCHIINSKSILIF